MKQVQVVLGFLATAAVVSADPAGHAWQPPPFGASRSPCPMLNAVANHGFIPRNGRNVNLEQLHGGFNESLHFVADILTLVGNIALTLSTTGDPTTFNLEDLAAHNVIEHDGSLSRNDAYFGDNLHFNHAIWHTVVSQFTGDTVPIATSAAVRRQRLAQSQAINPNFTLTDLGTQASVADSALYQVVLGDLVNGNPPTKWVKVLFEQERIPFNEGFVRSEVPIEQPALDAMIAQIAAL